MSPVALSDHLRFSSPRWACNIDVTDLGPRAPVISRTRYDLMHVRRRDRGDHCGKISEEHGGICTYEPGYDHGIHLAE